jgi:hypothetical protein
MVSIIATNESEVWVSDMQNIPKDTASLHVIKNGKQADLTFHEIFDASLYRGKSEIRVKYTVINRNLFQIKITPAPLPVSR